METAFGYVAKFIRLDILISVVRFGIVLGVLIFVHELGHFLVAKWRGIYVRRFSLGFGPKLVGFRKGETEYWISAFPLGGYVKMAGQEDLPDEKEEKQDADIPPEKKFSHKKTWEKVTVIFAGPLMNIAAAFLIFAALYTVGFTVPAYYLSDRIGEVIPNSPAEKAGLKVGDRIRAINFKPVRNWEQIIYTMVFSRGQPLRLEVEDDQGCRQVVVRAVQLPGSPYRGIGILPFAATQIKALIEGMPAARAGLRPGDVILTLNGQSYSLPDLLEKIGQLPGQTLHLEVERGDEVLAVSFPNGSVGVIPGVKIAQGQVWQVEAPVADPGSPLREGDQIVGINGTALPPEGVDKFIRAHPQEALVLEVERSRAPEPEGFIFKTEIITGTKGMIGIEYDVYRIKERYSFPAALVEAAGRTVLQAKVWVLSLINLIGGEFSHRELTGPIGIYLVTEKMAKEGRAELIRIVATISVILGLVNLLPIPVLDGGNMIIYAWEGIRKRPLKIKTMIVIQHIGLAIIFFLALLVFYNDIFHRLLGK